MNRSILASFVVLTAFATGCAATSEDTSASTENVTATASVTKVVTTSKGDVVATLAGLSLYTFDPDTTSASTCYDGCAVTWPAVIVSASDVVAAPFGTSARHDGSLQLTLNGDPLYRFANDHAQGDVKGDGLGGVWHLAKPVAAPPVPASPAVTQTIVTDAGEVLADANGLSLYTFDSDTTSDSTCYDSCATHWPALVVDASSQTVAPFATTTRHDGSLQLTQNGHPLYRFAGDAAPGDVKGDGLGGIWHLARP